MATADLTLFVDVPMTAFRPLWARDYQESYPAPPPSTVFGMLLSLIGVEREDKDRYSGTKMAIAILEESYDNDLIQRARLFRKLNRIKRENKWKKEEVNEYQRPDYQELVLWLKLLVWVSDENLTEKIRCALDSSTRGSISRHGGLCLGESTFLVNEIKEIKDNNLKDVIACNRGRFVKPDEKGFLSMPVWTSHDPNNDYQNIETFTISDAQELSGTLPSERLWITLKSDKHSEQ